MFLNLSKIVSSVTLSLPFVHQISCDQGVSRNMFWRFEIFNLAMSPGRLFVKQCLLGLNALTQSLLCKLFHAARISWNF